MLRVWAAQVEKNLVKSSWTFICHLTMKINSTFSTRITCCVHIHIHVIAAHLFIQLDYLDCNGLRVLFSMIVHHFQKHFVYQRINKFQKLFTLLSTLETIRGYTVQGILSTLDRNVNQLWNVIYSLVSTKVINEVVVLI